MHANYFSSRGTVWSAESTREGSADWREECQRCWQLGRHHRSLFGAQRYIHSTDYWLLIVSAHSRHVVACHRCVTSEGMFRYHYISVQRLVFDKALCISWFVSFYTRTAASFFLVIVYETVRLEMHSPSGWPLGTSSAKKKKHKQTCLLSKMTVRYL